MSRAVFCIACGAHIDDDAPLCACDRERLRDTLLRRIRETAPPPPSAVVGRRFDHVARLAGRIAAARGAERITGPDMEAASIETALQEACGTTPRDAS